MRIIAFENRENGADLLLENGERMAGSMVMAADGVHSTLRAQRYPDEGESIWTGRILWPVTTSAKYYSVWPFT